MTATPFPPTQAPMPGSWRLPPRRAMTLEPTRPGMLRVRRGRLWLTCNGRRPRDRDRFGDHILGPGEGAAFGPGERIVIESCDAAAAVFSWTPVWERPAPPRARHRVSAQNPIARLASSFRHSILLLSPAALCRCLTPPDGES